MRKGFTLIELLAVIVILAIIALIATPIVLNIINDAKESSILRSIEMYIKSVELSIASSTLKNQNIPDGIYSIMQDGSICIGTFSSNICTGDILKIEVSGEKPKIGSVSILNGKLNDVSLNMGNKIIGKNNNGEIAFLNKLTDICELKNGAPTKAGSKYECRVNAGTKYMFYVLTTPDPGTKIINLIMDQNINHDGTLSGMIGVTQEENATKYNLVAWNLSNLNTDGPVTAIDFLYDATKNWTNIPLLNYTYNDKDFQISTKKNISYTSFVSNNGIATIKSLTGTSIVIGTVEEPLRARLPIYSGVWNDGFTEKTSEKGEVADKKSDNSNSYLYENLDSSGSKTPYGYWTLSSQIENSNVAWRVTFDGYVRYNSVSVNTRYGVRPVISLNID